MSGTFELVGVPLTGFNVAGHRSSIPIDPMLSSSGDFPSPVWQKPHGGDDGVTHPPKQRSARFADQDPSIRVLLCLAGETARFNRNSTAELGFESM